MPLYWPAFEFSYKLDMSRLLPYIAAIEGGKAAGSMSIVPPQWRGGAAASEIPDSPSAVAVPQATPVSQIQERKLRLLVNNDSPAYEWVKQRFLAGSAPMSLEDILKMHCMVAEEAGTRYHAVGALRAEGFHVIVGERGIGFHVGAPSRKLPRLMGQYIQFLYSEPLRSMPAAIHSLVAHFFFATIHPFGDGNGRVARLVSAAILFQRGYNGHGFYANFNYFYQNETRYHKILYEAQSLYREPIVFEITEFVAFGLEGLAFELQGINSFLKIKMHRAVKKQPLPESRMDASRRLAVQGV